jgi:hypothetical protein
MRVSLFLNFERSGMKTRISEEEMRNKLLRDGGGEGAEGSTDAIDIESLNDSSKSKQKKKENSYGPATKVSELLLDMVCGETATSKKSKNLKDKNSKENEKEEDQKDEEEKETTSDEIPTVPDCLLTERSVILDDDFTRLHAGNIFKPRNVKESKLSSPGEARMCTF